MKFVEEKQKQVQRRFNKMYYQELGKFFTVPKVLITLLSVVFLREFYAVVSYETALLTTGGTLFSMIIGQFIIHTRRMKKSEKVLLFWQGNLTFIVTQGALIQCFSVFAYEYLFNQSVWIVAIITSTLFLGNMAAFATDKKVRQEQRRLYPEAFAV
jgi:hypothetical protein